MSSIRDFIYLESAFRCVSCSGQLKKYKDGLGNIYYICNSCNKNYYATKKPRVRYLIDIGVMVAALLFFMSRYTDKYRLTDYVVAWLLFVALSAIVILFTTLISHYLFDEVNLIEDTKKKEKRKFNGSLIDFLLRRHQTLCPVCNSRRSLVNKKGKDGKTYYQCLACNQFFVESKTFTNFSISYLLVMGIILYGIYYFTKSMWVAILFTVILFLYYVAIWLLYKYKGFEFYHQMTAAERNKKVL